MKLKPTLDVIAVIWFLVFSYFTALGFAFGSIIALDPVALMAPLALIPAVGWTLWRLVHHEGYFVEPTARQTIFLGGSIALLAIAQHFNIAEALSTLF